MSDWKLFSKSKSSELRAELDQAFKKSKPHNRVKIVLKKAVANIILNNNELVTLLPDVIPLMKIDDLEVRKLCFQFLINYCHLDRKEAQNALPFLARFREDSNATLRALSIKTMTSINIPEFSDLLFKSVKRGLKDSDPYVRRISAFAVARLYQQNPSKTAEFDLVEDLNDLLDDSNQVVLSNALAALNSITESGKSLTLTIDRANCQTITGFLSKTNEWNQIYILNALMAYVPQTSEEALSLIEIIIPSLQHENSAIVLNAVKVIVFFSNYVNNPELILPSLPKRLGSSLVSLSSKPSEIQFVVLRNVILLLLGRRYLVQFDVEMFFCDYDDPIYVKDTKLEIIYLLANKDNVYVVLRELEEYATEVDIAMARKAIRAFGNIAIKIPEAAVTCVEILSELVSNGISYIVQEAVVVVKNILRKYPGKFNSAIDELAKHSHLIEEPSAKAAMVWIIGQHGEIIPNSFSILEDLTSSFKDDPIEVQYASLTAVTKLYLKEPAKAEKYVIQLLQWATEEVDNPDVRDRGYFYWRLISSADVNENGEFQKVTKEIVLNDNPIISADNDNIDPDVLEELELHIGTLASIYLKPIQQVFRLAKQKRLPQSPALQPRRPLSTPSQSNSPKDSGSFDKQLRSEYKTPSPVPPPNVRKTSTASSMGSDKSNWLPPLPTIAGDSAEEPSNRKGSLSKILSRKASIITGRKNSKY